MLGWDQCQARAWDATCRHTALAALAQLRQAVIRNALCGGIRLPAVPAAPDQAGPDSTPAGSDDHADLRIPLGDAPVPAYPGQPRPHRIGLIRLSVAETARLTRLATGYAAGLITRARLAFALRWSAWRRRHQAAARWHHHAARLNPGDRKEVTACSAAPSRFVTVRDKMNSSCETATVIHGGFRAYLGRIPTWEDAGEHA